MKRFWAWSCLIITLLCPQAHALSDTPSWYEGVKEGLKLHFDKDTLHAKNEKERQLIDLYKKRDFEPLWLTRDGWGLGVEAARHTFTNAANEGLEPKDYTRGLARVDGAQKEVSSLLEAEIALSKDVLDYIDDMWGERLNPSLISKSLSIKPEHVDAAAILIRGVSGDQSGEWLKNLTLPKEQYQNLKKLLALYREKADTQDNLNLLPTQGPVLKRGTSSAQVVLLRKALAIHEFTSTGDIADPLFDADLEKTVKRFQDTSLIEPDGIVGDQTRRALARSAQDKVNQIIVSMERWRWLPHTMPERYLFVNIAGFELKGYENGAQTLDMPVIIGRDYRKTPVFTSIVDSVRFNPSWNVPRSIAVKDKLPKLQRDPDYFVQKGYVLSDEDGNEISPHSVNWSEITPSTFTYHLRQKPGAANALGKIRFNIDSPFDVYLHDTSDPQLFVKKVRTFSSGCIRVSEPVKLAYFVFNEPSRWTYETIAASMTGSNTQNVRPQKGVPIFITYFTVWAPDGEAPRFMDDIYAQDAAILAAIKNRSSSA